MPRNVFVLIDGTMCSSETGSNIIRIQEAVESHPDNEWLYSEGVASLSAFKGLQTILPTELATEASNLYKMLSIMNVTEDDRLFIIGYSRGAIIARILAQMITGDEAFRQVMGFSDRARKVVKRTTVDFLGLFDPVRGWPYPLPILGYDKKAQNNAAIKNISEIISIDEGFIFFKSDSSISNKKRVKSKYRVLQKLSQTRETSKDKENMGKSMIPASSRQFCLFPGVHSDVGGQKSNIALSISSTITMLAEITAAFPDVRITFNTDVISNLQRDLDTHSDIVIGQKTGFLRRTFSFPRRLYPDENTTLHPLADEIHGEPRIAKHLKFSFLRKYSVKKQYLCCPRYTMPTL